MWCPGSVPSSVDCVMEVLFGSGFSCVCVKFPRSLAVQCALCGQGKPSILVVLCLDEVGF